MKALDQGNAEPDHDAAHDQCANNSPDQHAMVRDRRYFEIGEDENENKDVIDAQRVFDQIAGKEVERALGALQSHYDQAEGERKRDPEQGPPRSRAHAQLAIAVLELSQVGCQCNENTNMERDPKPNTGRHRRNRFTSR